MKKITNKVLTIKIGGKNSDYLTLNIMYDNHA